MGIYYSAVLKCEDTNDIYLFEINVNLDEISGDVVVPYAPIIQPGKYSLDIYQQQSHLRFYNYVKDGEIDIEALDELAINLSYNHVGRTTFYYRSPRFDMPQIDPKFYTNVKKYDISVDDLHNPEFDEQFLYTYAKSHYIPVSEYDNKETIIRSIKTVKEQPSHI